MANLGLRRSDLRLRWANLTLRWAFSAQGGPHGAQSSLFSKAYTLNIEEIRILKVYKLHMLGRILGEVI